MKDFVYFANLGFAVITPIIISIYGAIYLRDKFNLPDYVVVIGIFFGLIAGVNSFCKFAFGMKGQNKK